ncbi:carbonic anhydrase 4-like [Myripristis murdjan]|uniref:Carbonic anhydrase n=1 Tax=Myripristis murdjan TaxID=586833 RepID=A0A667X0A5_9TELE|nr:carbonic anhydrase 4-like [Myripristis murdjan]XP_029933722.1 carbonic anhydrase 4-like [Myripristis murdjan]
MDRLLVALVACALVGSVHCATGSFPWCYHLPTCNDTTWPTQVPQHCNGSRQSPINIVTADATGDSSLTAFTFTNYDSKTALKKVMNTGRTVKVITDSGVQISGGGLSDHYESIQFHLHWGNGSSTPGSEHTVNGKRYPMEIHIVHVKASYRGNTTQAIEDSNGLAVLGFLIEVDTNTTGLPASWKTLSSYLANITEAGQEVAISHSISLDDLLTGVDRTKYYRYLGSLTTPTCNEAVVWTVFKESIKVSKDVIDLFSTSIHAGNSSAPLMTNVYRSTQPAQPVRTQLAETSGDTRTCYSLGLMALSLLFGKC